MKKNQSAVGYENLIRELSIDCEKCSGLCCTALFFSKMDGFPQDKKAGISCMNLETNFRCSIHASLLKKNMKGCLAYDCFGAGQKVTQNIFGGESWREVPKKSEEIFKVFLVVYQFHQILWYLLDAYAVANAEELKKEINELILENTSITKGTPQEILNFDLEDYRSRVNAVLKKSIENLKRQWGSGKIKNKGNLFGKSFKGKNLDGEDFSMCMLIATNLEGCSLNGANFLGADMRDTNLKNADLSGSIFLTQGQINSARGNSSTRLPAKLVVPASWKKDKE